MENVKCHGMSARVTPPPKSPPAPPLSSNSATPAVGYGIRHAFEISCYGGWYGCHLKKLSSLLLTDVAVGGHVAD
jgi:hypothetical protein